tara:strand:+ start:638 stop:856 length:219 start_codon:yes stop_codon:yes gene_type:complete
MKKISKVKITINGKKRLINPKMSLRSLLYNSRISLNKVAIELNQTIIDKKRINKIFLKANDKIEIVHFIGGG